MLNLIKDKVVAAYTGWKVAFNSGDAAGCAAFYEEKALMVAKPFGTFKGRADIQAFWKNIIDQGFCNIEYINPQITVVDENSALLKSDWKMNKAQGIITRELWVLQENGTVLLREDHFEAKD